ncbi:carbonate dehydratase [Trichoderma gamsii]|uniref:Carbonate dehydratase n=1 Tax=Trichoderma gamsii TaxID=398673 RepID=A0A2P4Z8R0_9HYPO|nr:carbonate dehydratase [Trichoderma gamsii]PON20689.1 carbonate dehydratase [Trichoderma gamsii]
MTTWDQLLERNREYSETAHVPRPDLRDVKPSPIIIFCCIDLRVPIQEFLQISPEDCGFTYHTDNNLRQKLRLKYPNLDGKVDSLSWDTFGSSDRLEESVREDLRLLKEQKFIRQELRDNVKGYVYDIKTGKLKEVV